MYLLERNGKRWKVMKGRGEGKEKKIEGICRNLSCWRFKEEKKDWGIEINEKIEILKWWYNFNKLYNERR